MTSQDLPDGFHIELVKERGWRELAERDLARRTDQPEHTGRRKYRGATMLRRLWATPGHLRVGHRDKE